ncbi:MAG: YihY/virulence factor BrkB family protein [Clostridia bacterium]
MLKKILSRLWKVTVRVFKLILDPYYGSSAAELAYFFLLSVVPLSIVLAEILGFFSLSLEAIQMAIGSFLSPEMSELLSSYITYTPSKTLNLIFILLAIWSASRAQYALSKISNYAYGLTNSLGSYVRSRLLAVRSVLFLIFFITFSLSVLVYGELLLQLVSTLTQYLFGIELAISNIWLLLRWPLGITIYFFIFSFVYALAPYKRLPIRRVIPGSIFAAIGVLLSSYIYSAYISNFSNYNLLYGSMAALVSLLFWFFIISFVLVLGVNVNIAWEEERAFIKNQS